MSRLGQLIKQRRNYLRLLSVGFWLNPAPIPHLTPKRPAQKSPAYWRGLVGRCFIDAYLGTLPDVSQ
jgi:hypothetical protein